MPRARLRLQKSENDPAGAAEAQMSQEGSLRTFRLDRIAQQPQILDEPAVPAPEDFDIGAFRKFVFRMYGADKPEEVTLLCDNHVMRLHR